MVNATQGNSDHTQGTLREQAENIQRTLTSLAERTQVPRCAIVIFSYGSSSSIYSGNWLVIVLSQHSFEPCKLVFIVFGGLSYFFLLFRIFQSFSQFFIIFQDLLQSFILMICNSAILKMFNLLEDLESRTSMAILSVFKYCIFCQKRF